MLASTRETSSYRTERSSTRFVVDHGAAGRSPLHGQEVVEVGRDELGLDDLGDLG